MLRDVPPETKRRVYDALDVRVVHDTTAKRLQITATVEPETAALLATEPRADELVERTLRGWDSNPQPFG